MNADSCILFRAGKGARIDTSKMSGSLAIIVERRKQMGWHVFVVKSVSWWYIVSDSRNERGKCEQYHSLPIHTSSSSLCSTLLSSLWLPALCPWHFHAQLFNTIFIKSVSPSLLTVLYFGIYNKVCFSHGLLDTLSYHQVVSIWIWVSFTIQAYIRIRRVR